MLLSFYIALFFLTLHFKVGLVQKINDLFLSFIVLKPELCFYHLSHVYLNFFHFFAFTKLFFTLLFHNFLPIFNVFIVIYLCFCAFANPRDFVHPTMTWESKSLQLTKLARFFISTIFDLSLIIRSNTNISQI